MGADIQFRPSRLEHVFQCVGLEAANLTVTQHVSDRVVPEQAVRVKKVEASESVSSKAVSDCAADAADADYQDRPRLERLKGPVADQLSEAIGARFDGQIERYGALPCDVPSGELG
nr:hypothetical protein [Blastococcus sp. TF02-8]